MTRFKRLAQFLARALEYKYRFPLSPDYPSDDSLFGGRRSWIKTEREVGIIPLARQVFKEYGRYYSDDSVFVTKFVLGRQRRDPFIERLLATETPTTDEEELLGKSVEEEALKKQSVEPSAQEQPGQTGTAESAPTPQIKLPRVTQVIAQKEPAPPEQLPKEFAPPSQEPSPSQAPPVSSAPPVSDGPRRFPQIPPNIVNWGKATFSNASIFLKKKVTRYLTFGNLITSIFTALGGIVGAILGKGSALATVAGAGAGGIGSAWVRSAEGRRSLLNFGSGAISRTVNFSSQFSTQSLFKGPPKKVWLIFLTIFAFMALGAGFLPTAEQEPSPPALISGDKFLGVNIHSLVGKEEDRINHMLSYLNNSCRVSMIRIWGTPDRGSIDDLRKALDQGQQNGVRFIVALADYPNRPNDFLPFGLDESPTAWYSDGYKEKYKPYVEQVVTTLKNHTAIYAWELANEPHCNGNLDCVEPYHNWVKDMSSLIKSLDPNHLVSIGTMARRNIDLGDSVDDGQYERNNALSSIGALTGHYYQDALASEKEFMLKGIAIAKKLNKPFYTGEVGLFCGTEPCTMASADSERARATLLRQEIADLFNAGATGYLVWQYSDRKNDWIDNDPFSFFEDDPICSVLKEFSQKAAPPTLAGSCPAIGKISTPYGYNLSPKDYLTDVENEGCKNLPQCHNGIDIAANEGTTVKSSFSGTVTFEGYDDFKGNYIVVTDTTSGLEATFEHLKDISKKRGESVSQGEIIGTVGATGRGVTGPHLHFKLKRGGTLINPLILLSGSVTFGPTTLASSDDISQNNYANRRPISLENWGYCNQ